MKKFLVMVVCLGVLLNCSLAVSVPTEDINQILSCMGVTSDTNGYTVTRGELAKMLVNASEYKKLAVAGSRISPFSDVSFTNELAPYVKIIAEKGIMTAYSDGEFKPNKSVLYEEAVTTIVKLLGYTNEDFSSGYPMAQLMIAEDIGLTDGVSASVGESIDPDNLSRLIYNALSCNTKDGKNYAEKIGYSTTNGVITLSDVMDNNSEGPVTVTASILNNLFGLTNPNVYVNGKAGSVSDIALYDVAYYNVKNNTVWIYKDKITGIVESISPNKETPTQVSISGTTYKLSTYVAQKAFGIDGIEVGQMATLLLDRNSAVSDAYLSEKLYSNQIGVIIDAGKKEMVQSDGNLKTSYYATILLSTGEKTDIALSSNYSSKIGYTAKITYKNGTAKIYSTSKTTDIYGLFDKAKSKIGSNKLSSDVSIMEVDEFGNTIYLSTTRLDGVYLAKESVALVTKNASNEIDSLIIKDVTGDTAKFGIITDVSKKDDNESYEFILNGQEKIYSSSEYSFNVEEGPVQIYYEGQSISKMSNLSKVEGYVINVNNSFIETSKDVTYKVSGDVAVYIRETNGYTLASMDDAMSGEYNVTAYFDKTEKNGGLVRIVILS